MIYSQLFFRHLCFRDQLRKLNQSNIVTSSSFRIHSRSLLQSRSQWQELKTPEQERGVEGVRAPSLDLQWELITWWCKENVLMLLLLASCVYASNTNAALKKQDHRRICRRIYSLLLLQTHHRFPECTQPCALTSWKKRSLEQTQWRRR